MKRSLLSLGCLVSLAVAAETVLWPSEKTVMRAQSDSAIGGFWGRATWPAARDVACTMYSRRWGNASPQARVRGQSVARKACK